MEWPRDERSGRLRASCGDDPQLYDEILSLLESEQQAKSTLGESVTFFSEALLPGLRNALESETDLPQGARIGPYQIIELLGRGGMGKVYLARRADGSFEKQVALKIVKRGMDTDEILARFIRERQLLATLDHPNIARLLDGGATPDGRPYIVMEYVLGEPVTDYADHHRLSIDERLDLFRQITDAVAYAHQRLVVHRDLKPSNILVTDTGTVKLLDFGIAKLLTETVDNTQEGKLLLTPKYAAPEQQFAGAITTSTDVYALGRLLYELLAGESPGKAKETSDKRSRPSLQATVTRPSSNVTEDAALLRKTNAQALRRRLRGDLDTITLKALRFKPEERYASAEAFGEDIRRAQLGIPVVARSDTFGYRTGKFFRRYPRQTATAVALFVVMIGFAIFHVVRITAERDRAQLESEKSAEVTQFLVDLFEANDPYVAQGDSLTMRQFLDQRVSRIESLRDRPELYATLQSVVANIYTNLGNPSDAESHYRQAVEAWTLLGSGFGPQREDAVAGLAGALVSLGKHDEAEPFLREVLSGSPHNENIRRYALLELFAILHGTGQSAEADSLFVLWESLTRSSEQLDGPTAQRLTEIAMILALNANSTNDPRVAQTGLEFLDRAIPILLETYGEHDPRYARALSMLTLLLSARAARDPTAQEYNIELEAAARRSAEVHRAIYTDPHLDLVTDLYYLATALRRLDRLDEAESTIVEAIRVAEEVVGPDHPIPINSRTEMARIRAASGYPDEALMILEDIRAWWSERYNPDFIYVHRTDITIGSILAEAGRFDEAEPRLLAVYEYLNTERGLEDQYTQRALLVLAELYEQMGDPEKADRYRGRVE